MPATAEVTLTLRSANPLPPHPAEPGGRHLSHAELTDRHGAPARVQQHIEAFAKAHRLNITELDSPRRIARLQGTPAHIAEAFSGPATHLNVPKSLSENVEAVTGIPPEPRIRRRSLSHSRGHGPTHTVQQLAGAYAFPSCPDLRDQTLGLLEFGGGFHPRDIAHFCETNGVPTPDIQIVEIDPGAHRPARPDAINDVLDRMDGRLKPSALDLDSDPVQQALLTLEVTMDLQILAALAPGARMVVYFANPDHQFRALHRAVYDHRHCPSVLSISWGQPETELSAASIHAVSGVLETAAHLGITVCSSSGDQGALNGSNDGTPTVNFPASSPFCLTCGGTTTHFEHSGPDLRIHHEVVWNSTFHGLHGASGGGVSRIFPPPAWQQHAGVPVSPAGHHGRGVPDVAGSADPRFGCDLLIGGRSFRSAGTSAVAPLWAALVARCNAAAGRRCGHINPLLYRLAAQPGHGLRPVLLGSNGAYHAGPGWNPCTGHGTPIGVDLLRSIQQALQG